MTAKLSKFAPAEKLFLRYLLDNGRVRPENFRHSSVSQTDIENALGKARIENLVHDERKFSGTEWSWINEELRNALETVLRSEGI
ncbi:MAG: hypothetical protein HYZ57_20280 [Acidobacteria bacterium]|nr:hypothetical protein [Acidobacteriota bacterium]